MSQKQAQKYLKKVKGTQLQIDDLVLVKRVAWKGRHKIQNKQEPEEYVIFEQPNKSVLVYRVKPVSNGKERVLCRKSTKRMYVDDMFSIIPKGKSDTMLGYLSSVDPHIKITIEQPNTEGAIPFLDTLPKPKGKEISISVYRKPTYTDRYLDFNSSHPISAKKAVVRALMDRAENVSSDPEILANEMEHLCKVPHYNNYPQWLIDK